MSENNTDLNEVFEEEMDDADVITVPIDETLSNSGEAADAAAVGAALALKADKDELPATIKVNNQPADNQGLILIDGTDIPVSDSNTKTLAEAIEEASEMTAATIPMTGEAGTATIGETIGVLQETVEGIAGNMSADKIPMSEAEDAETIAEAIGIIEDNVEELAETVEGMEQKTADKVLMETGSTVTVKDAIETLDRTAVKSVNRKLPDASGDVDLSVVPLAENLQSDKLQSIEGEFTLRTTGGTGSVSDGKAYPQHIYGNSRHDGFVAEVLNLTVIPIARTEPDEPITATIDRDTFLEEVEDSDTINLYYTTEWSEDPADYGVTVTGDPVAGDQITIVYVKEVRGTIVVAEPERLVGTGWNLFNYNAGYARVVKYSETYGYKIGGTFTSIAFAASLTDDRISLLPNIDGLFSVPGDGYVFVTGGNNTDTYILTTWSDWIEGPSTGYWEAYRESGIDLSAVVETYFPYGMLKVGTVRDEIDLVAKRTISRIERMVYSEENRATAAATGRAYDFDENNIYVVRAEPVLNAITIDSEYSVSEHGLEWFTETELPLDTEILYGKNLRDKLERNVLTISAQTLTEEEKTQVRTNIGAMSQAEGDTKLVAPTEAGTAGQLLHLKEDGSTEWTTQGTPTDAQVGTAVSAWLDAHPEATTTVEDGAISRAKLNDDLKAKTDAVPDLKSAFDDEIGRDLLDGVTFTTGYSINDSGEISSAAAYRYSSLIPVQSKNYKLLWELKTAYSCATRVHGYNSAGTWVKMLAKDNQSTIGSYETDFYADDVAFIRVSAKNTDHVDLSVLTYKTSVNYDLINIESGNLAYLANYASHYVNANGEMTSNNILRCSGYIEVPTNVSGVELFAVYTNDSNVNQVINPALVAFDGSKNVVGAYKTDNAVNNPTIIVPLGPNVKYIRYNRSNLDRDEANTLLRFVTFGQSNTDYVGTASFSMTSSSVYSIDKGFVLKANKAYKIVPRGKISGRVRFLMHSATTVKADVNKWRQETVFIPTSDCYLRAYNVGGEESLSMTVDVYECGTHDIDTEKREYYVSKHGMFGCAEAYTSFTQCLLDLKDDESEKTIWVDGGDYDIYQEYVDANVPVYTGDDPTYQYFNYCVWVPKNTHIIGVGLVRLIWNPAKENVTWQQCQCVSPLNVAASCTIENIEVHCKNGRYCLHNDGVGKLDFVGSVQKYINCRFYKDEPDLDTDANERYGKAHTIGFGIDAMQRHEYINCEFYNSWDSGLAFYGHTRSSTNNVAIIERTSGNIIVRDSVVKSANAVCARLDNSSNGDIHIRTTFAGCYFSGRVSIPTAENPNAYDITVLNCNNPVINKANANYPVKYYPPLPE